MGSVTSVVILQVSSIPSMEELHRNFYLRFFTSDSHICLITTSFPESPHDFEIVKEHQDFTSCFKVNMLRVAYLLIYFTYDFPQGKVPFAMFLILEVFVGFYASSPKFN